MPQIIDNRYQILSEIGHGSMSAVYNALDTETGRTVAVKVLAESTKERKLESILRFRREATTMAKLSHPNIVQLYAVGEYEGTYYLVMELVKGQTLKSWFTQEKPSVDMTNQIILQLASALDYAHQRRIVHRDVKPTNAMVCEDNDKMNGQVTVKLMDFGLARLIDLRDFAENVIIGTVAYMAPEQTGILKRPVDIRADLYALGITWYEMLTGKLPFMGTDIGTVIHQHIAKTPVSPRQLNPDIPEPVEQMVLKLLSKSPSDRYQTANGLQHDLKEYQQLVKNGTPMTGFSVARTDRPSELTFQTRLVGREDELKRLAMALDNATDGNGSLFLIGGESGSGKTRLVDELREYSHLTSGKGVTFLSGRCYEYATNIAYNPFVEAIEEYVEQTSRLSAVQREFAVSRIKESLGILGAELTRIVPSLESLIGEQPPSVELEPERQRFRFFNIVSDFLCSIATEEQPLVLFLDDLQWGDDGTLRLMQHLTNRIANAHVFVIGAYRREEVGEGHLLMQVITELKEQNCPLDQLMLQPLTPQDIQRMVDELLGAKEDMSRSAAFSQLYGHIITQTKGSPFFIGEMVKTLVEADVLTSSVSGWDVQLDGLHDIPLAASVAEVVLRRINAINQRSLNALSIASVIGKQFEFDLLLKLSGYSSDEILDILDEGVQFQLIREQYDTPNVYSFTHDKIIEALYNRLPQESLTQLHGQIGAALESANPEPAGAVIYALAHHYGQSEDKASASKYSIHAGDLAKTAYANTEAIRYYGQALGWMPSEISKTRLKVMENLGDVYSLAGNLNKAVATYGNLLPYFQGFDLMRLETKIAFCFTTVNRFTESLEHYEKALASIGKRTPRTSFGWTASLLAQLGIKIWQSLFPFLLRKNPKAHELAKIYMSMSWMYVYSSDMIKMACYMFKAANEADHAYDSVERVFGYSALCLVYPGIGMNKLYQRVFKKVQAIVERLNNPVATAIHESNSGGGDYYCGNFDSSIHHLVKAIEIYNQIGDPFQVEISCIFLGFDYFQKGDLENSLKYYRLGAKIIEQIGGVKERFLAFVGFVYGYQGRLDEGIDLIQKSLPSVELSHNLAWLLGIYRSLGELYYQKGDWEEAIQWMEKSLQIVKETHSIPRLSGINYICLADAYLGDRARIGKMDPKEKRKYLKMVHKLCIQGIRAGADLVSGQAYRVEGIRFRLEGNPKKAMKYFQKSVEILTRKDMKLQLALTYYEIGTWMLKDGDAQAQGYLEKAAAIFEEIGALLHLRRTRDLLGVPTEEETATETDVQQFIERRERDALIRVVQQISTIQDLDELLNRMLSEIMRVMGAERGFVMLQEDGKLVVKVARNISEELMAENEFQFSRSVLMEVEHTGMPQVITDAQADKRFATQVSVLSYSLRSILCMPLSAHGQFIGLIYIDNHLVSNLFTEHDLELMMSFGQQATNAIENAHLRHQETLRLRLEQEMNSARDMQMSLLPRSAPSIEGFDIAGICEPTTEVGGDCFNYIWLDEAHSKFGIVLMDATGHGMKAATSIFLANGMLQSEVNSSYSPEQIMDKMNKSLCITLPKNTFVAMSLSVIDTKEKSLSHYNAGIPQPIIVRDGKLFDFKLPGAFPLGCMAESEYAGTKIPLQSGDFIVFLSDGLLEATNKAGGIYADERLETFLTTIDVPNRNAQEIIDEILTDVRAFISKEYEGDDMTVVVLKLL